MDENFDDGSFRGEFVKAVETAVDTVILYSEVDIDLSSDEFIERKRATIDAVTDVVFGILDDSSSEIEKRVTLIAGIALISIEKGYLFDSSKLGQLLETMG